MNAITLSSLDTLNDIDSEDDQDLNDLKTNLNAACTNYDDDEDDNNDVDENFSDNEENNDNTKMTHDSAGSNDDESQAEEDADNSAMNDYDQKIANEIDYYKRLIKANQKKAQFDSIGQLNSQSSNVENTKNNNNYFNTGTYVEHKVPANNFDQDWSYSQHSNNTFSHSIHNNTNNTTTANKIISQFNSNASQNTLNNNNNNNNTNNCDTQKIINEIVRKLKPYILRCVKKEVRSCFDKYYVKHNKDPTANAASPTKNNSKYDDNSLTKIGDF